MYYKAVHKFALETAKLKIIKTLQEALEQEIISEAEYTANRLVQNTGDHAKQIYKTLLSPAT